MKAATTPFAWLFDVDGVVVHLEEHKIVEMQIVDEIIKHLSHHEPVALISGRSAEWQRDNVVAIIHQEFAKTDYSPSLLDNLYISGEFGGTAIEFQGGKDVFKKDSAVLVPENITKEAEKIAEKYHENFLIDPKQTFFTIYTDTIQQFSKEADSIIHDLQQMIDTFHLQDELDVHRDTTAINIRHKNATKRYATRQIVAWLEKKGIIPEKYMAFGDSASDIEIGEELFAMQVPFTFIFVGLVEKLQTKPSFPLVETKEKFDKGTLEFLQNFHQS